MIIFVALKTGHKFVDITWLKQDWKTWKFDYP